MFLNGIKLKWSSIIKALDPRATFFAELSPLKTKMVIYSYCTIKIISYGPVAHVMRYGCHARTQEHFSINTFVRDRGRGERKSLRSRWGMVPYGASYCESSFRVSLAMHIDYIKIQTISNDSIFFAFVFAAGLSGEYKTHKGQQCVGLFRLSPFFVMPTLMLKLPSVSLGFRTRCASWWQCQLNVPMFNLNYRLHTICKRLYPEPCIGRHRGWNVHASKDIIGLELCARTYVLFYWLSSNMAVNDVICNPSTKD